MQRNALGAALAQDSQGCRGTGETSERFIDDPRENILPQGEGAMSEGQS